MESFYWTVFAFFLVATGFLEMKNRAAAAAAEKGQEKGSALFNAFKNNYLLVYSLMMGTRTPPLDAYDAPFRRLKPRPHFARWVETISALESDASLRQYREEDSIFNPFSW